MVCNIHFYGMSLNQQDNTSNNNMRPFKTTTGNSLNTNILYFITATQATTWNECLGAAMT